MSPPLSQSSAAGRIRVVAPSALVATSVDEALRCALELVCAETGWPVGHVLRVTEDRQAVVSSGIWVDADPQARRSFVELTSAVRFGPGTGLPGLVLDTGRPQWTDDLRSEGRAVRRSAAAETGIRAAAAFPIVSSHGIEGVMEFFGLDGRSLHPELLDVISNLGLQLGAVIDRAEAQELERRRAADAVRDSEAKLEEAQRIAHIGTFSWEVGNDSVLWSAQLKRIYGLDGEAGPMKFSEYTLLVHPDDRARVRDAVLETVRTMQPFEHDYRILHSSGEVHWVHARGEVTETRDGLPVRVGGYCQDITDRRSAEERRNAALRDLSDYQRVLEQIARDEPINTVLEALCREVERRLSGAACSVLLVDAEEQVLRHAAAPSLPLAFAEAIDGLAVASPAGACGAAAATGEVVVVKDVFDNPLTADFVDLAREFGLRSVWSYPLEAASGTVIGTFAIYRSEPHTPDRTERGMVKVAGDLAALAIGRRDATVALARASQVDPLTGLPNRARFLDEIEHRLSSPGARVTVMFVDLDRFKWINDSLGHPAGDRILVDAARRLRAAVSPQDFVARFGGDEFTVLLRTTSDFVVGRTAERIERAFDDPFDLDGGEFYLTVSVGIAIGGGDDGASALIRDADAAMYAAKEQGRARHVWFDDRLRLRAVQRVSLESQIRRGISRSEFVMYYQPVADLTTGEWSGSEGLARWVHPELGLVGPDAFIPLAEETGLILPLGDAVFDQVVRDAPLLSGGRDLPVAVNISPVQLSDPWLTGRMRSVVERHGTSATRVLVELTESSLMSDFESARTVLSKMTSHGFSVVIDDFGTGYSSIARLTELPVTGIKIDRSFTARIGEDPVSERVVGAIIDLAHALGMKVVAEGVETHHALERLRDLACDYAQGFLLARPLPPQEASEVLAGRPEI